MKKVYVLTITILAVISAGVTTIVSTSATALAAGGSRGSHCRFTDTTRFCSRGGGSGGPGTKSGGGGRLTISDLSSGSKTVIGGQGSGQGGGGGGQTLEPCGKPVCGIPIHGGSGGGGKP